MRVEDAMEQLSAIHAQVLRSETYRGYRAGPVAATGALALGAALLQRWWLPTESPQVFVWFWIAVALLATAGLALELGRRVLRESRGMRRGTWLALGQLLPALGVGALVTVALFDSPLAGRIPALWVLCFGLGIVASRPYLPPSVGFVAWFYLLAGGCMLLPALAVPCPNPLTMGLVFGMGQGLAALVLHRAEEQRRVPA